MKIKRISIFIVLYFIIVMAVEAKGLKYRVGQPLSEVKAKLEELTPIGSNTSYALAKLRELKVERTYHLDKRNGAFIKGDDGRGYTKEIGQQSIVVFLDTKYHFPLGGTHLIATWAFSAEDKLIGVYLTEVSE